MKKILILGILLALIALPSAVLAMPSLQVSLSKYEPYPASPGDTVKIWLLVQNTAPNSAKDAAKNVIVEVIPEYPFSMYGSPSTKTIGLLGANNDYLVDFTLKVDDKAIQGNNNFKVRVKDTSSTVGIEQDMALFVQSRDSTIAIDSVKINPPEIEPGSDGTITVTVKNMAPSTLTDLSMKLYLQSIIGSTIVDLPFVPLDSSSERRIYRLDAGQSTQFSFDLKVYPDATSKLYKIPFVLEYYDNLGNKQNTTDFIGIVVNSRPDISVLLDKTDLLTGKRGGTITLKFINKGLSDIKFLTIKLLKSDDYDLLSTSDTTYIGNLVSDDYQTAEYTINVKGTKDSISIPVLVRYRDANNRQYERTENVILNLIDSSKLSQANKSGGSPVMIIVIVLVVVVAAWIFIRKRRKQSKKGQFN